MNSMQSIVIVAAIVWLALTTSIRAQLPATSIVTSGNVAPGTGGATWQFFGIPALADDGSIAFRGSLNGAATTADWGVWSGIPGSLSLIAREGDVAPGAGGRVWRDLQSTRTSVANGGQTSFTGGVLREGFTTTEDVGIWARVDGNVSLVALMNSPTADPIVPINEQYAVFSFGTASIRSDGGVAFSGQSGVRSGSGFTSSSLRYGIWEGLPTELDRFFIGFNNSGGGGGDPAPGMPGYVWWQVPNHPGMNDLGAVVFSATARNSQGSIRNGLWVGAPEALELVAERGQPAPGLANANWEGFGRPAINDAGQIALLGFVLEGGVGFPRRGVWTGQPENLELVAYEGQPAAGIAGGVTYTSILDASLNASGQVAFASTLAGPVSANNNEALFATDPYGQVTLVARLGRPLRIDGVDRTINGLSTENFDTIAGDAELGTARIAYLVAYGASTTAIVAADLNDVVVDPAISTNSFVIEDSTRSYVTAGNIIVGRNTVGPAAMTLRNNVEATAHDAMLGIGPGVVGELVLQNGASLQLIGDLLVAPAGLGNSRGGTVGMVGGGVALGVGGNLVANGASPTVGDASNSARFLFTPDASNGQVSVIQVAGNADVDGAVFDLVDARRAFAGTVYDLVSTGGGIENFDTASLGSAADGLYELQLGGAGGNTLQAVRLKTGQDYLLTIEYRNPETTGPLVEGFDPIPETILAEFKIADVRLGQTTIGLDQLVSFDLEIPGDNPSRGDLNSFELALDDNGMPQSLFWNATLEPAIVIANNNFMLEITGTDPDSEEEFRYFWSESTSEFVTVSDVLPGDFNGDGAVSNADLTLLLNHWGDEVPPTPAGWTGAPPTAPAVNNDELTLLLNHWGDVAGGDAAAATAPASSNLAIPEPSSVVLVLLLTIGLANTGRWQWHQRW